MNNNLEMALVQLKGPQVLTKEAIEQLINVLPDTELVPYAATGENNGEFFSVFGFSTAGTTTEKLNDDNLDAFNSMVLHESEKQLPPGIHKIVNIFGIKVLLRG